MKKNTPTSDPIYKRLYSFAEMVADLLRSVVPKATLEALDLRSLEKVPAEYVGDHFQQRHGDTVWRVRAGGPTAPGPMCWCCWNSSRAATRRWPFG